MNALEQLRHLDPRRPPSCSRSRGQRDDLRTRTLFDPRQRVRTDNRRLSVAFDRVHVASRRSLSRARVTRMETRRNCTTTVRSRASEDSSSPCTSPCIIRGRCRRGCRCSGGAVAVVVVCPSCERRRGGDDGGHRDEVPDGDDISRASKAGAHWTPSLRCCAELIRALARALQRAKEPPQF